MAPAIYSLSRAREYFRDILSRLKSWVLSPNLCDILPRLNSWVLRLLCL
jgi:hypothetical protein